METLLEEKFEEFQEISRDVAIVVTIHIEPALEVRNEFIAPICIYVAPQFSYIHDALSGSNLKLN